MTDVIVAGAGPAGAIAACLLSRAGRRVLLSDEIEARAEKVGDLLAPAARAVLRFVDLPVLETTGVHARVRGNLSSWNSIDLTAEDLFDRPDGAGWRLDRVRFDADLRAAAIAAGVAWEPARVRNAVCHRMNWLVQLANDKSTHAPWIIDATGRRAFVARRAGAVREREPKLVGIYAFGKANGLLQCERSLIEAVPNGWWYAACLPFATAVAGIHVQTRDAARILRDPCGWNTALAQTRHVRSMATGIKFGEPRAFEACGARLDRFSGCGWIACGDAALSFDPLSGYGLLSALQSGIWAAQAVDAALRGCTDEIEQYTHRLELAWRTYRARCRAAYASERRWTEEAFWRTFVGSPDGTAGGANGNLSRAALSNG